jgi:hypothetical protein
VAGRAAFKQTKNRIRIGFEKANHVRTEQASNSTGPVGFKDIQ